MVGITGFSLSLLLICFLFCLSATVGGNVIVNTVAGVPPSPFQANKRLASPVIPGTLSVSHARLSSPIWLAGSLTTFWARHSVLTVLLICLACKCSRSPGGPCAAEGRDGCCPHRSGCHSSRSRSPCGHASHGVCSGLYHSEPSAVADAPNGHSGHTRYACNQRRCSCSACTAGILCTPIHPRVRMEKTTDILGSQIC